MDNTLAAALEREHREIDAGIAEFSATAGRALSEPMVRAMDALRRHIHLEEAFLFPPLREAGLMAPVFVMFREHGQMWRAMDAIEPRLADPAAAASVQDTCRELVAQLDAHNRKEELILYAQVDSILDDAARESLAQFIADGRMPDGWVCATATN